MSVNEFKVATAGEGPYGVAVRGAEVWTTLVHAGVIARLTDGQVERFDLDAADCRPSVLVAGPDDAIWFTRSGDNRIGRIASDGTQSTVEVPGGSPYGICVGPDQALWFTVMTADTIGRVGIDGAVTEFPIGTTAAFPAMITASADALWFTLNAGNAIGRMFLDGTVTTFPLPTEAAGPVGISAGANAIWFAEILAGQIGRIDEHGTITEFPLPDRISKPHAVAATPDGGCWATLWASGDLISLAADGSVVETIALGDGSEPHGLAIADDESVWVALETGSLAQTRQR